MLDLFRSWDANGDGEISRKEFHKSIPALGLDVAKSDIDALFEQWDSDGGGSLAYKELRKILNTRPAKKMALSGEGSIVDQVLLITWLMCISPMLIIAHCAPLSVVCSFRTPSSPMHHGCSLSFNHGIRTAMARSLARNSIGLCRH